MDAADSCFVLFDPADAPARLYRDPCGHRLAATETEVGDLLDWIEAELGAGRELALFAAFEAATALAALPPTRAPITPLLEALSFEPPQLLQPDAVDTWLAQQLPADGEPPVAALAGWRAGIARADYQAALGAIAAHLQAGDCYQIDYTFALHARACGHPLQLYRALRAAQPTPYRCLARLRGRWVLSLSPELFFRLEPGGRIAVRPMKGTAPRAVDPQADAAAAAALAADPKNRAENLMILDLLRNDLGRIARTGSVQAAQRFQVEALPAAWQMTSSASAELREGLGWRELWAALFPCGSVVGAPKHRAMSIIGELEPQARGLYTGAIGWIGGDMRKAAAGDTAIAPSAPAASPATASACFSVAIRTLELDAEARRGWRRARLGLGSGVVLDSDPAGEWDECLLKGRFATRLDPGFGLIETFAARLPQDAAQVDAHLRRLQRSARALGFRLPRAAIVARLQEAHAASASGGLRSRIELRHDGRFSVQLAPLEPLPAGPVGVLLAEDLLGHAVLDPADPLLAHKTTRRARYDAAWQAAQAQGAFDALFFNSRGELCEGGRSSVFVKLGGRWFTPPLRCGVLPGVTRARLLADPDFGAAERVLSRADLLCAEALLLCNALRGARLARLL